MYLVVFLVLSLAACSSVDGPAWDRADDEREENGSFAGPSLGWHHDYPRGDDASPLTFMVREDRADAVHAVGLNRQLEPTLDTLLGCYRHDEATFTLGTNPADTSMPQFSCQSDFVGDSAPSDFADFVSPSFQLFDRLLGRDVRPGDGGTIESSWFVWLVLRRLANEAHLHRAIGLWCDGPECRFPSPADGIEDVNLLDRARRILDGSSDQWSVTPLDSTEGIRAVSDSRRLLDPDAESARHPGEDLFQILWTLQRLDSLSDMVEGGPDVALLPLESMARIPLPSLGSSDDVVHQELGWYCRDLIEATGEVEACMAATLLGVCNIEGDFEVDSRGCEILELADDSTLEDGVPDATGFRCRNRYFPGENLEEDEVIGRDARGLFPEYRDLNGLLADPGANRLTCLIGDMDPTDDDPLTTPAELAQSAMAGIQLPREVGVLINARGDLDPDVEEGGYLSCASNSDQRCVYDALSENLRDVSQDAWGACIESRCVTTARGGLFKAETDSAAPAPSPGGECADGYVRRPNANDCVPACSGSSGAPSASRCPQGFSCRADGYCDRTPSRDGDGYDCVFDCPAGLDCVVPDTLELAAQRDPAVDRDGWGRLECNVARLDRLVGAECTSNSDCTGPWHCVDDIHVPQSEMPWCPTRWSAETGQYHCVSSEGGFCRPPHMLEEITNGRLDFEIAGSCGLSAWLWFSPAAIPIEVDASFEDWSGALLRLAPALRVVLTVPAGTELGRMRLEWEIHSCRGVARGLLPVVLESALLRLNGRRLYLGEDLDITIDASMSIFEQIDASITSTNLPYVGFEAGRAYSDRGTVVRAVPSAPRLVVAVQSNIDSIPIRAVNSDLPVEELFRTEAGVNLNSAAAIARFVTDGFLWDGPFSRLVRDRIRPEARDTLDDFHDDFDGELACLLGDVDRCSRTVARGTLDALQSFAVALLNDATVPLNSTSDALLLATQPQAIDGATACGTMESDRIGLGLDLEMSPGGSDDCDGDYYPQNETTLVADTCGDRVCSETDLTNCSCLGDCVPTSDRDRTMSCPIPYDEGVRPTACYDSVCTAFERAYFLCEATIEIPIIGAIPLGDCARSADDGTVARCGDGVCDEDNAFAPENCMSCSIDCGACTSSITCGDGVCADDLHERWDGVKAPLEDCLNCAADCGYCAQPECGDGVCGGFVDGAIEDVNTCPVDCSVCGDGVCSGDETPRSCGADCIACGDGLCFDCGTAPAVGIEELMREDEGDGEDEGETEREAERVAERVAEHSEYLLCRERGVEGDPFYGGDCYADCPTWSDRGTPSCGDGVCYVESRRSGVYSVGEVPDPDTLGEKLWDERNNATSAYCPEDCPPVCGDGFCQLPDETAADCPMDCGPLRCGDGFCHEWGGEGCTGTDDCREDCAPLFPESCAGSIGSGCDFLGCDYDADIYCGDGICRHDPSGSSNDRWMEDCENCPQDCEGLAIGGVVCEVDRDGSDADPYCGDEICQWLPGSAYCDSATDDCPPAGYSCSASGLSDCVIYGEDRVTCPQDCVANEPGDGVCDPGEDVLSSPSDCVRCGDGICGACDPELLDLWPYLSCLMDAPENQPTSPGSFCPADCTFCGNLRCDETESVTSCPGDCPCGDGVCDSNETPANCSADCGFCGDGWCDAFEDGELCPDDCNEECGDGFCVTAHDEDPLGCPADCGPLHCGDGRCTEGYGGELCSVPDFSHPCSECLPIAVYDDDRPVGLICRVVENLPRERFIYCGDGRCAAEVGEDCFDCAADCGPVVETPSFTFCAWRCGDGVCQSEHGENSDQCPEDCP